VQGQSKPLGVSVDLVKEKRAWAPGNKSSKIPDYEKERKHEKVFCIEFIGLVTMLSSNAFAQKPVTVGGGPMFPNNNIIYLLDSGQQRARQRKGLLGRSGLFLVRRNLRKRNHGND
jgi:hypothetical protein